MNLIDLAFINKFANSQSSGGNSQSGEENYNVGNFEYPIMISGSVPTVNASFSNFNNPLPIVSIGLNQQFLNSIILDDSSIFSIAGNSYIVFGVDENINTDDIEAYICDIKTNDQYIPYINSVEKINIDFDEVDLSNFFTNTNYYDHFYGFYMPNLNGWRPKERAIPYKVLIFNDRSR